MFRVVTDNYGYGRRQPGPISGSEAFLAGVSRKAAAASALPHTQSNPSTPKPAAAECCRVSPQQDEGFDSGSSLWNVNNNNKAVTPPTPPATPPSSSSSSSLPRPEQWLGKVAAVTLRSTAEESPPLVTPKRNVHGRPAHLAAHGRAYSLDTAEDMYRGKRLNSGTAAATAPAANNPFDPEYTAPARPNTNPFLSSPMANGPGKTVKSFEVQM